MGKLVKLTTLKRLLPFLKFLPRTKNSSQIGFIFPSRCETKEYLNAPPSLVWRTQHTYIYIYHIDFFNPFFRGIQMPLCKTSICFHPKGGSTPDRSQKWLPKIALALDSQHEGPIFIPRSAGFWPFNSLYNTLLTQIGNEDNTNLIPLFHSSNKTIRIPTYCPRKTSGDHQLRLVHVGTLSHYLQGFIYTSKRWVFLAGFPNTHQKSQRQNPSTELGFPHHPKSIDFARP